MPLVWEKMTQVMLALISRRAMRVERSEYAFEGYS